jgi:pyrroline-5-carboxylate reductase
MNISFIGGGNMAGALIGGLISQGFDAGSIQVVDPSPAARAHLAAACHVSTHASLGQLPTLGDMIVMAVKPQQLRAAAEELRSRLGDQLVLSIAAGVRLADLSRWLGGHAQLARCMPNTPALIGAGVSGLYATPAVSAAQRAQAAQLFEAVGRVIWVDKEQTLDAITAVSGSGPAYVFYFIEALQQAAVELGLDAQAARELAIQTFRGAAELAVRADEPVSTLRERVTSKGGTTERALATMQQQGAAAAIIQGVHAACARAAELGDELGRDPA